MMTTLLDEAITQIRELPDDEQDLAAKMLFSVVSRRSYRTGLTQEQLEDLDRLLADLASGKESYLAEEELAELRVEFRR